MSGLHYEMSAIVRFLPLVGAIYTKIRYSQHAPLNYQWKLRIDLSHCSGFSCLFTLQESAFRSSLSASSEEGVFDSS